MFDIESELTKIPNKPGIYIMKDKVGKIIYIGKAVILKNRVRQYFQKNASHTPKTKAMVQAIASFEYIVTDNELEALILECNLIKKHRPKYNIMLRDDKTYPYIKVTLNEAFPRVLFTRSVVKDGSVYFGPYPSATAVRDTLEFIGKIFPYKTCSKVLPQQTGKNRACLNFHIDRCPAPCIGQVERDDYMETINGVISFLEGRQRVVIERLRQQMYNASAGQEYEKAAKLRDKILTVQKILEKQKIVYNRSIDCDVVALASNDGYCCIQLYNVRDGRVIDRVSNLITEVDKNNEGELLSTFLTMHYEPAAYIPPEIISAMHPDGENTICNWLSEKNKRKVVITVPQRAYKYKLLEMLNKNANMELMKYAKEEGNRKKNLVKALDNLKDLLGLEKYPEYIEAFDISNIGSDDIAASMVTFYNGEPCKEGYRRYKIKSVIMQNDAGSIKEVIERRYRNNFSNQDSSNQGDELPGLILIDGGKPQVSAAKEILGELGLNIPVAGMVKDTEHRTKGLIYNGQEIEIKNNIALFKLISCIQDEVHRFAISYSKKLRSRRQVRSVLDDIKGIGPAKRTRLLREFGSVKGIKSATVDELAKHVGKTAAENVYRKLNEGA